MQNARTCDRCGLELAPALQVCPSCGRLVHAEELNRLAGLAESASASGRYVEAQEHWRHAAELLPAGSRQAIDVQQRVDAIAPLAAAELARADKPPAPPPDLGKWGMLGVVGLMAWKFKWLIALVATKGKLVLFGLTKVSTLASMAVAVGAYATLWNWKFALGFVLIIYIHEMGHVYALRRLGIRADAPLFIPGLGAFIRLRQRVTDPIADATMGLAGPVWGLAAALGTAAIYEVSQHPLFAALTQVGGIINLFNLMPILQLDGCRGFRALSHIQRWMLLAVAGAAFLLGGNGFLVLIVIIGAFRTIAERTTATAGSWTVLARFATLIVALSALAWLYDLDRRGIMPGAQNM